MKILTVCAEGNSRSVATRLVINQLGNFDVLSCGAYRNKPETLVMLSDWADLILVAESQMADVFPEQNKSKINKGFELGPDFWQNPFDQNLHTRVKEELKKINFV